MAIVVERDPRELHPTHALAALGALGWFAIAGSASLGAGAIHAAAIGVHSEHRQAVVTFTIVAVIQLGFGALALARPGRILLTLGAIANLVLIGGWVMAKANGISFIDGLEVAEDPQTADSLAAGLALLAVVAVVAQLLSFGERALRRSPLFTGAAAIVVAALAVPGMLAAGSHAHAEGEEAGHSHGGTAAAQDDAAVVPPKPFDPALPIDLGGVEGVTLQQQAAAENLLAVTLTRLPQFADPAVAESRGFVSIGDGVLGHEHYLNAANMNDGRILDPDYPESLVYDTRANPKRLVAAMFMLNGGDTLADVPELGGKLTQWHVHDNLCFNGPRVVGLTNGAGRVPSRHHQGPGDPDDPRVDRVASLRPVRGARGHRGRDHRRGRDAALRPRARPVAARSIRVSPDCGV